MVTFNVDPVCADYVRSDNVTFSVINGAGETTATFSVAINLPDVSSCSGTSVST